MQLKTLAVISHKVSKWMLVDWNYNCSETQTWIKRSLQFFFKSLISVELKLLKEYILSSAG